MRGMAVVGQHARTGIVISEGRRLSAFSNPHPAFRVCLCPSRHDVTCTDTAVSAPPRPCLDALLRLSRHHAPRISTHAY